MTHLKIVYFSCDLKLRLFYFQVPFYPPQQMFEDFSAKVDLILASFLILVYKLLKFYVLHPTVVSEFVYEILVMSCSSNILFLNLNLVCMVAGTNLQCKFHVYMDIYPA